MIAMNNARSLMYCCTRVARSLRRVSSVVAWNSPQQSTSFLRTEPAASCHRMAFSTGNILNAGAKVRIVKQPVRLTPTKAPLILTPKAISRIKGLLSERPGVIGLRIGVRQRGCSGLTYTLDYVEEKPTAKDSPQSTDIKERGTKETDIGRTLRQSYDVEVEQDGVRIFIDRRAQLTLLGTEMDYAETKLGAEFVFSNPNIKSTCGCGESFMLS